MLVDSHAHLDMAAFNKDRDEVVRRARGVGVRAIITVGTDMTSSRAAVELAESYTEVFAAVGIHPHSAAHLQDSDLQTLAQLSRHPKVVALGETGLDFYRNLSPRKQQEAAFIKQLRLAAELGLPLIVHSRHAHKEVLAILAAQQGPGRDGLPRGVIHCFGGDAELVQRYLDLDFALSFSASVTYPSPTGVAEVVRGVPLDRLLVETDAPFLSPHPQRRQRNEPARVSAVAARVAQLREVPFQSIADRTTENARLLFRLPGL